jgi:hypothetical protein
MQKRGELVFGYNVPSGLVAYPRNHFGSENFRLLGILNTIAIRLELLPVIGINLTV